MAELAFAQTNMKIKTIFLILLFGVFACINNSAPAKDDVPANIPRIHLRENGRIYLGIGDGDNTTSPRMFLNI